MIYPISLAPFLTPQVSKVEVYWVYCQKLMSDPHVLSCTLRSLIIFFLAMNQNFRLCKKSILINLGKTKQWAKTYILF